MRELAQRSKQLLELSIEARGEFLDQKSVVLVVGVLLCMD